jgi:hypothetical protein
MTADVDVTASLGAIIHDVAEGRVELGALLACIERWAVDMEGRERAAVQSNDGTGEALMRAIRARGMYLAVLSLNVRLELLQAGKQIDDPAI